MGHFIPAGDAVSRRVLIIDSGDGRHLAAMLAVSATRLGQALIAASKQHDEAAVRGRIEAELAAIELSAINSVAKFRELVYAMAKFETEPLKLPVQQAGVPAFGSQRPYLKKKKGRS